MELLKDGEYIIFTNFVVAKNDDGWRDTPIYNAMFQEQASRFYFKNDETFVNLGNAYNYECRNSWDGILGMIPCIFIVNKKGSEISSVINNELLTLHQTMFYKIYWQNQGIIYKNFPKGPGDKLNKTSDFMYFQKINVGSQIQGNIFFYNAFNFNNDGRMQNPIRINDYREIKKENINDVFFINNSRVQIPIIKEVDFYDGWFSYDDTVFICLAQIGVYPLVI